MTWELPWVTSGVAELPVDIGRVLAYAATEGNSGATGGDDCKVTATGPASGTVNISGGVVVARSRFIGAAYESYVVRNDGSSTVTVPPTGGSSRIDFVYVHIIDPGQPGQPTTAAPAEVRVITDVPSTATKMDDVPGLSGVTGVPLARISRATSTSIVNAGDITDIRSYLASGLVGEIKMWPAATPPNGWLTCVGQAVSRSTYSALFSVIGTTFGAGDGVTTFALPNLESKFPIGVSSTHVLGSTGGNASISLPNHTHVMNQHQHGIPNDAAPYTSSSNTQGGGSGERVVHFTTLGVHNHFGATLLGGDILTLGMPSDIQTNILNPFLALNFIICAV